jgi:hypothetical protein
MAIFRYKPSLLHPHEVDAPGRGEHRPFTRLFEMTDDTQFIAITHNKRTMGPRT